MPLRFSLKKAWRVFAFFVTASFEQSAFDYYRDHLRNAAQSSHPDRSNDEDGVKDMRGGFKRDKLKRPVLIAKVHVGRVPFTGTILMNSLRIHHRERSILRKCDWLLPVFEWD